jgi:transcriptional regulator with XRE-family HTH domain
MKNLSERIKALRLPGETQSDFAQRLGTTQASISRYVNGRHPDRETLVKIARRTGVSLDWLLTGKGPQKAARKGKSEKDSLQVALAYLGELKSIPGQERSRVQGLIRDLAQNKQVRKELLACWESMKKGWRK